MTLYAVSLTQTATSVSVALGLVTLCAAVVSYLRWWRPRWKRGRTKFVAVVDTLVGRDAVVDSITGREISPALPSFGVRMESVEHFVERIATVIEGQQLQDRRLEDHETRITSLEVGAVERIVTKAESAAAWKAVEAISQGVPDESAELD